jgi:hypothetical protein
LLRVDSSTGRESDRYSSEQCQRHSYLIFI